MLFSDISEFRADEQAFKEKFGYDLRQSLTESYSKNDNAKSHYAVGGNYRVDIPISSGLVAQIKQIGLTQLVEANNAGSTNML